MRPRTAVGTWVVALALGGLTGGFVLPAASEGDATAPVAFPTTSPPASPSASPTPTPVETPTPTPTPTARLTEGDLLSVSSFADQSVEVEAEPQDGRVEGDVDATACVSDDVHQTATLEKLTGHAPGLEGYWTETSTGDGARQLVGVADDVAGAQESVRRLLVAMEGCQEAPPGHVVLGRASSTTSSATRSASYVGRYTGEQNTTGRAPDGAQPCGGTVVARNGARFTVVDVFMCLDGAQLAGLADAASERLG